MKSNSLPTQEYLQECFTYTPETGLLLWKQRPREHFKTEMSFKTWNTRFALSPALNYVDEHNYRVGALNGKKLRACRVIWKLVYGTDPDIILHSDGNTLDNRIEKLSNGTVSENAKDMKKPIDNTSGVMGVSWDKNRNKWQVYINVGTKRKALGRFENFEEAVEVRKNAEIEHEYHRNHGKR